MELQIIKYGALTDALRQYTYDDVHEQIAVEIYRRVIKGCYKANNQGQHWDIRQAASILVYLAFHEEHLQLNQLNLLGLKSLDLAERLLEQNNDDSNLEVNNRLALT